MKAIRCALKADVGLASNQLHRVFNQGSFSLGGRFCGGWRQSIPAECRAAITINGDPTLRDGLPPPAPNPPLLRIGPRNALTVIVAYLSGKPALRRPFGKMLEVLLSAIPVLGILSESSQVGLERLLPHISRPYSERNRHDLAPQTRTNPRRPRGPSTDRGRWRCRTGLRSRFFPLPV